MSGTAVFVGSSGGHLAQMLPIAAAWPRERRSWVTFDTPDARAHLAEESASWAHHPTTRNIPNLLRNTALAWRVMRRDKPDVVVSTGAGVALPFFVLGRLRGSTTVFVEVCDRLDTRTLTGRLCRPFTSVFCVQTEEQQALYPGSVVVGSLL